MSRNKIIIYIEPGNSSIQDKDSNITNCQVDNPTSPMEQQILDKYQNDNLIRNSPLDNQLVDESNNKFEEQDKQIEQSFNNFPENNEEQESYEDSDRKTPVMNFNFNKDENKNFFENEEKNVKKEDQTNITSKVTKETTAIVEEINLIKKEPHITNIVFNSNFNCKLNLKLIALMAKNTKYNIVKNNFVTIKLENSNISANFFSSGEMTCCGAKFKEQIYKALKKFKKIIKKCGYDVHIKKKQIIIRNIASTCKVNFKISLKKFYQNLNEKLKKGETVEMPEKHPAIIYKKKIENSNICYIIYKSGSINITGAKEKEHIDKAFKSIFPELLKVKM